jgi:hypothetical protein
LTNTRSRWITVHSEDCSAAPPWAPVARR